MPTLLPALAGSGSRPAGGSALTPRGAAGNAGEPGDPAPPPRPVAGTTMTGSVIGGIGRSAAAAPTPGTASMTDGSTAGGGNSIRGGSSGRPDGTSMPPPPPPPPPGAGSPGGVVGGVVSLVSLDVVSLDVDPPEVDSLVVVPLDVVRLVVVGDVVVFVLVVFVVVFVGDVTLGGLDRELSPHCLAFPLLPQLPSTGFPPLPVSPLSPSPLSVPSLSPLSSVPSFPSVSPPAAPLPSGPAFGPSAGASFECAPPGSPGDEGSARAKAPPRPHRNRPDATTQADAAPRTRVRTSPPPFTASTPSYSQDPTILAQTRCTVCCRPECTRDRDAPIRQLIRTIVLGYTTTCFVINRRRR